MLDPKFKIELKLGECYEIQWTKDPDTGVFLTVGFLENVTIIHKRNKTITELYLSGHPSMPYQKIDMEDVMGITPVANRIVKVEYSRYK